MTGEEKGYELHDFTIVKDGECSTCYGDYAELVYLGMGDEGHDQLLCADCAVKVLWALRLNELKSSC